MIQATVYNDPLIPATGLKQIEITLTDSSGNRVYNASNTIAVSIKGNAKLLGLENSDSHDVEGYHSSTVRALNGQLIAYILPEKEGSSFEIQIGSPGLKTAVLSFK
jgi:beta-galactosidase